MTSAEQLASGTLTPALVLDVFLKLGIVLILIYLTLRLLRHYAQQASGLPARQSGELSHRLSQWLAPWMHAESGPSPVRTVQVHPLNRQVTLYLLEVETHRLLVSVSGAQVQLLGDWPGEAVPAPDQALPAQDSNQLGLKPRPYLNLHSNIGGSRRWTDVPPHIRPNLPPDPLNSESEKI